MADSEVRITLRLPEQLRDQLQASADENSRSMNGEIVDRLDWALSRARSEAAELQAGLEARDRHIARLRDAEHRLVATISDLSESRARAEELRSALMEKLHNAEATAEMNGRLLGMERDLRKSLGVLAAAMQLHLSNACRIALSFPEVRESEHATYFETWLKTTKESALEWDDELFREVLRKAEQHAAREETGSQDGMLSQPPTGVRQVDVDEKKEDPDTSPPSSPKRDLDLGD